MAVQDLTEQIKQWLETEPKDIQAGAQLLLRINRNQIFYNNVMRRPQALARHLEYELKKIYNSRLKTITKAQVDALMVKVDAINLERHLDNPKPSEKSEYQRGKRADHDELPAEIQQLWIDNGDITRQMRECHTKIRMINTDNSSCPDNDRFAFATELVKLDEKLRKNYYRYDHYIKGQPVESFAMAPAEDAVSRSKKAVRLINLHKGRYAKTKDADLGERLQDLYKQVINPSEKLTSELKALNLIS